jgi:hypothetical protein
VRTSRCDDPSRCVVSCRTPRPGPTVSSLADAGTQVGNIPGPTFAQRLGGESELRLLSGSYWLRHMVNEIVVAFLGTLPLAHRPESKPFTPWSELRWNAPG